MEISLPGRGEGWVRGLSILKSSIPTMGRRSPAPKKPWKDDSPAKTDEQRFPNSMSPKRNPSPIDLRSHFWLLGMGRPDSIGNPKNNHPPKKGKMALLGNLAESLAVPEWIGQTHLDGLFTTKSLVDVGRGATNNIA